MKLNRPVRFMHACLCALSIGILTSSAASPAIAAPAAPAPTLLSDTAEEDNWYDKLCRLICCIGSHYGVRCTLLDGTPYPLDELVIQLDDAFHANGPVGNVPQSFYVDIIEALEIIDANYEAIGAPTNDHADALLTEIYLAEGGDPAFLPETTTKPLRKE